MYIKSPKEKALKIFKGKKKFLKKIKLLNDCC